MNFSEAESYLYSLGNEVEAMKLGLENIRTLLAALGDPQKNYKKVQVAGTNGKGSVCAFLDSICVRAGIKTGLYTSPHLVSITERIKIDGVDISEHEFARLATLVREKAETLLADGELTYLPTFFEQVTGIALVAFAEDRVELAILETGLGGRLDATTAANAEVCAITQIALDHQEYLGETIEEIAAEKAAIITEETEDVVIGRQSRPVMAILRNRCREFGIQPINDGYNPWCLLPNEDDTVEASLTLHVFHGVRLGLKGHHQIENAQTAIQIAEALMYHGFFWHLDDEMEFRIVEGIKAACHPGRLEYVGNFLLDGAHNTAGAEALVAYLDEFVDKPITMIFGAMKEKDVSGIAEILWPRAERLILTRPSNSRAMTAEELLEFVPKNCKRENIVLTNSVEEAVNAAGSAELVLVTGSLYLVGEVKKLLNN